jgi:hypothetical protein
VRRNPPEPPRHLTADHGLPPSHPDYQLLQPIAADIFDRVGGSQDFGWHIARLLRSAIDAVIDTRNTKRFTLAECEQPEKTSLGIKLEIALRALLNLDRGDILDANISGTEVDIKTTMTGNWMIPPEAINHVCLIVSEDEDRELCSVGLFVAKESHLTASPNQDKKRSLSSVGRKNVWWLLKDYQYPHNVWKHINPEQRRRIMAPIDGTSRVVALFTELQGVPISRSMINDVGQQLDFTRRVRKNGGARDIFSPLGIAILSGTANRRLIAELGLPLIGRGYWVSYKATDRDHIALLRAHGLID